MKKAFIGFYAAVAVACILLIIFLATGLWKNFLHTGTEEDHRTRIITPREANLIPGSIDEQHDANQENLNTKIPMEDGEVVIAVLTRSSEGEFSLQGAEEQFVAYHYSTGAARAVYLTFISYDEQYRRYRRMWNLATAATRPETVSLSILDIVGDRNNCIIVTGMNAQNEHTMTIFRRNMRLAKDQPFAKIAELQIDGSIIIQETGRSLAYQQGIAGGHSFTIAAYGHDSTSDNILDQIETIYSFNPSNVQFERTNVSRIPGSQIEQRRLREILSGTPGVFENFIHDLWYYVSPQGTLDLRQYLYFDPAGREIIFYGDNIQQVFRWENSIPTRYGLYIRSQNISISTLRRFIDIELESLDSIRLRISEDMRIRVDVGASWDGTYRRATTRRIQEADSTLRTAVNAAYDSSWGRIQFYDTGEYTLNNRRGRYIFFKVDENDILELRPNNGGELVSGNENRMIYRVETVGDNKILSRVRLGTGGIQDMMEIPITLTLVDVE